MEDGEWQMAGRALRRPSIFHSPSSILNPMIPFLTYPLAMIALAALPALAAIYVLRHRFRRRQVSSLMLWQFRVQSKEGGAKVHRLQLPLLFFIELLALLLLVTAATGPHWKLPQATRPLIVVLDDSFSMRAVSNDATAQSRAREFLKKVFRFQPPPSTRLLLAGNEPRLLGAPARTWPEVEALLQQWTCRTPDASVETALTLASELGKQQANVLVLTDHPPADEKIANERLQWRAFGVASDNLAIVNASRTANGDEDRCLLEIANLSKTSRSAGVQVQAGSNALQQTRLSLAPQERQRLVFNIPKAAPMLAVTLDPDALADDNRVQLLPPIRKKIRVQVSLTNAAFSELVERTLAATGMRAAISDNPELVIHHADSAPGNAWSLRCQTSGKAAAYTGPFIIDGSHPAVEGIALAGAVWAAGPATNAPNEVPVILAGNVPLLTAREDLLGRQFLTLNLDPELSTIQRTPDWPILFWNLLQWRATQIPGLLESNARLGAEVLVKTTGEPVVVTWPDGTVKSFPRSGNQLALETPLAGLYSVAMGTSTNLFSVNTLAADESDLQTCATGQWGNWRDDAGQRYEQSAMAWLFALAALGVLTAHLCLVAAGRGRG
jgi:hypothetical protein